MSYAQKRLPCDPTRIKCMSEKLIRSHRFHYLRFRNPDSVAATDSRSASNPATTVPGSQPRRTDSRTQMLLTALDSLEPGHETEARAARRTAAHRVQPGHHALPAPGEGAA